MSSIHKKLLRIFPLLLFSALFFQNCGQGFQQNSENSNIRSPANSSTNTEIEAAGPSGAIMEEQSSAYPSAKCLIKNLNCPNPKFSQYTLAMEAGLLNDSYDDALSSAEKCLARALPIYYACQGHQPVTATYYNNGKAVASKIYNGYLVGAVRWDAWTGSDSDVGVQVNKTLSPNKYHSRLPFYAQVLGYNSVNIDGARQAVMDREIQYATQAGISYWAFVYYPNMSELDVARNLYRQNTQKNKVNYSLIIESQRIKNLPAEDLLVMLKENNYQRVLNNRPLLYFFDMNSETRSYIEKIRVLSKANGLSDPYIVLMGFDDSVVSQAVSIRANAISRYATVANNGEAYTAYLRLRERKFWNFAKENNLEVVPPVTTGWDPRPRIEIPILNINYDANSWGQRATAQEVADHLRDAFSWISQSAKSAPTNAVIMYAWNEFDEGGWICPTLNPLSGGYTTNTDRIAAIRTVIDNTKPK